MSGLHLAGTIKAGSLLVDVDLHVEPGETVAVLGPNGAGKTTLLRGMCGLIPLTSGAMRLEGRVLDDASGTFVPPEARSIGVVFQDLFLFPHLDVSENVAFGPRANGVRRHDARRLATEMLEGFGLEELHAARVGELSGGQAQRVALARALAPRPRALLLDEPLSALDAQVRGQVRRTLRDHLAAHGGPCVLVTHDPVDAAALADRVIVLEEGRVTASGSLGDLAARPRTAWAAELAGTNLLPARAAGIHLHLDAGGELTCADGPPAGRVLVAVRPASVALHRHQPDGSPRNVWSATIAEVEGYGDRRRVRLAGAVPLVAEVTGAAAEELDLRPGESVWVSLKATDVVAYPD